MALQNNFLPQTSLVFGVRDFAPQIEANAKQDREGLQNAFKFATQVYDYMQGRKQADLMEQDSKAREDLEKAIENDKILLAKRKEELAKLMGGV